MVWLSHSYSSYIQDCRITWCLFLHQPSGCLSLRSTCPKRSWHSASLQTKGVSFTLNFKALIYHRNSELKPRVTQETPPTHRVYDKGSSGPLLGLLSIQKRPIYLPEHYYPLRTQMIFRNFSYQLTSFSVSPFSTSSFPRDLKNPHVNCRTEGKKGRTMERPPSFLLHFLFLCPVKCLFCSPTSLPTPGSPPLS